MRTTRTALLAVLLCTLVGVTPATARGYENGEMIEVRGTVTDRSGIALEGVRVVLEASRRAFRLRKLGRATEQVTKIGAETDATGNYVIRWPWDSYYNTFEVSAGVSVRDGSEFRLEKLATTDLDSRIGQGSPIVAPLVIENGSFVRNLKSFVESLDTHDEMRIYEKMGKPDKIDRMTFPTHEESTWWYFEDGKTYRFSNGSLLGVAEFDPVEPF